MVIPEDADVAALLEAEASEEPADWLLELARREEVCKDPLLDAPPAGAPTLSPLLGRTHAVDRSSGTNHRRVFIGAPMRPGRSAAARGLKLLNQQPAASV